MPASASSDGGQVGGRRALGGAGRRVGESPRREDRRRLDRLEEHDPGAGHEYQRPPPIANPRPSTIDAPARAIARHLATTTIIWRRTPGRSPRRAPPCPVGPGAPFIGRSPRPCDAPGAVIADLLAEASRR
jgi:hypothetical protein